MAMAWIWTGMVALSVFYGLLHGTIGAVGSAAMEGAALSAQGAALWTEELVGFGGRDTHAARLRWRDVRSTR